MSDQYEQKYTDPGLRRRLKDELMESDRGGRSGQWSARKSQLLVQEYERQGGGYRKDHKDDDAKSLEEWAEQEWQTAEGSADADQGDGMDRYLPKRAWELLSEDQRRETQRQKAKGDRQGEQFVENTPAAKAARAYVDHGDASGLTEDQLERLKKDELMKIAQRVDLRGRSKMRKAELAEALRDHYRPRDTS